ncbi:hypothetical protein BDK51DRAFT_27228 [Blyttiomyces helicus]|uniref:Uncharacterized protein n=1 Tax=Blyttiomyces helicus TaxID=388810 RepID=A0A4P9WHS8_9FUNG|nr:hypothetical protein BDK51DRAFT_27228 [Blyttiomyces helicus]|eukprot:RKO90988.1 hypothetical protein BDK51DRAFT_27228 [Blyttiomyces helicus]
MHPSTAGLVKNHQRLHEEMETDDSNRTPMRRAIEGSDLPADLWLLKKGCGNGVAMGAGLGLKGNAQEEAVARRLDSEDDAAQKSDAVGPEFELDETRGRREGFNSFVALKIQRSRAPFPPVLWPRDPTGMYLRKDEYASRRRKCRFVPFEFWCKSGHAL